MKVGIAIPRSSYLNYMGMDGFLNSIYNWKDASGQAYYAQTFEYVGGDKNCFYITGNEPSSSFWNENLDIAGKVLATGGTYTYMESILHYSEVLGKWMDKQGNRRPLHENGNQYTGGKLKYGRTVSRKFTKAGQILGFVGTSLSVYESIAVTDLDAKVEYAIDAIVGCLGTISPTYFGTFSTVWFLGGKQISRWYGKTVITPMIEQRINPGLIEYQPFK